MVSVRFGLGLVLACLWTRCFAIPIYIDDPAGRTNGLYTNTQRFESRLRVANSAWDLGLGPTVPSTGYKNANLGNTAAILPVSWQFELLSDPTIGLQFRVKDSVLIDPWTTLLWRSTEELSTWTPFERAFNTLRIQVFANGNNSNRRSALLSDLTFSTSRGVGYFAEQGLTDLLVAYNTPGSNFSNFPVDGAGTDSHWIYSGENLAAQAWRLSGKIDFNSLSGDPRDNLKLAITGSQFTYITFPSVPAEPVPEPSYALMIGLVFGVFVLWKAGVSRRKRAGF